MPPGWPRASRSWRCRACGCARRGFQDAEVYARILTAAAGEHADDPTAQEEAWLDFAQLVASWLLRGYGVWSVERRADGRLIGFLPLDHEFGDPEPEIGWFPAEAQGQGYATEAAAAARRFALERLGFPTLVSYVDRANRRSIGVAERLGARREAVPHPLDGDVLVFRHPAQEARQCVDFIRRAADLLRGHRESIDRLDAILLFTLAERFKHTRVSAG